MTEIVLNSFLPNALAIGVPYELFWTLNPRKLQPFIEAQKQKQKLLDSNMWLMGMYIQSAVTVAVEHNLAGKKAQTKYLEKPLLETKEQSEREEILTEEQKKKQVDNLFLGLQIRKDNFDRHKEEQQKQMVGNK